MADYDKAGLDAMTDKTAETIRSDFPPLPPLHARYANEVAGYLAVQFPGTPDLARIVLACTQFLSPLGAEDATATSAVAILGAVWLQLSEDGQDGRG